MIKIAIISPYKQFAEDAKKIEKEIRDIYIETFIGYFEEGIKYALRAEKENFDVIISRGITAEEIKKKVKIPVLEASETLYDLLKALYEARKFGDRISVFLYYKNPIIQNHDFRELICDLFKVDLNVIEYNTSKELEQKIKMDKNKIIIGGAHAINLSENYGKRGILLRTGKESLFYTIKEAKRIVKFKYEEMYRTNLFKAILDFAHEGIIAVDKHENISILNPMAEKILNLRAEDVVGKNIKDVLPTTKLHEVVRTGKSQLEQLQDIGGSVKIITSRVPIIIKNKIEGAIATFKDVSQLQKVEKKIRMEMLKKGHVAKYTIDDIYGESEKIRFCKKQVERYAKVDSNVLIIGETGTGKELFAQAIHNESSRKNEPFIAINCAALPENLLESELFGYVEGSFTGARKGGKAGLIELAHGGTLCLDEIGEMPLNLQSKLLRVLQEKEVRRIGDDKVIPVDIRIVSLTNRDLFHAVKEKKFREDLFYRINVLNLSIPPLRERKEDIPILIKHFVNIYSKKRSFPMTLKITDEAMEEFKKYNWPGNVRELQNFVERIMVHSKGEAINLKDISDLLPHTSQNKDFFEETSDGIYIKLSGNLNDMIDKIIEKTLDLFDGNQSAVSRYLGVSRTYLWRKLNNR